MGIFLSDEELEQVEPAENSTFDSPIPTQVISNGEFNPIPQTEQQKQVEARINALADELAPRQGLSRRGFMRTQAGMAAAFLAMNEVFGSLFDVNRAEAAEPGRAKQRADSLKGQFIFDVQTHFVHDGYTQEGILGLAAYAKENWNPALESVKDIAIYKFENFVRQMFLNSDTKVAILSGAPFDDESWNFLTNDSIRAAVDMVNSIAGSGAPRMLGHAVVTPGQDGWMEKVDHAIETLRPDSWKMYTIGDPLSAGTKHPYRLDDEKLVYPFYEKAQNAGINTICIHKGLMPADYEKSWKGVWEYNTVWDVGKAAKDWPNMNFVIYHGGFRGFLETPDAMMAQFEKTGELEWASDLARIPEQYGVNNVYAEMGTSFANCATTNPRLAAAMLGTWIKGLGLDRVVWGTDSVLYGSPQWQIEALRRLEIPEDMQKKHGFAPLGEATGLAKSQIFGFNSARMYGLNLKGDYSHLDEDRFSRIKHEYELAGGLNDLRDNVRHGWVARTETA